MMSLSEMRWAPRNFRKCLTVWLFTLCLFVIPINRAEAENERVMGVRVIHYPPQYFHNEKGLWEGLDVELARAMVERAGFKIAFLKRSWTGALKAMESGDLDIMMNLSKTDERSAYMRWIGPERYAKLRLVVHKDNVGWKIGSLDDLAKIAAAENSRFGIQKDVHYSIEFHQRLENDTSFSRYFETVINADQNPKKVLLKRILGFFEDQDSMRYKIKRDEEFANLRLHEYIIQEAPVYFGISKKGVTDDEFQRLETSFNKLEKEGVLENIRQREW